MDTLINPKDAFLHVVYDYRCLARAEFAFRKSSEKPILNTDIPEIGTVARNAILSKARSLVDFYIKTNPRPTDITLKQYFGVSLPEVEPVLHTELDKVRASLEVHDIHLTTWRDSAYRHANISDSKRQRIDWDSEQANIVEKIIEALNATAPHLTVSAWDRPFLHLYDACLRALERGGDWNKDLSGKTQLSSYLERAGL